MHLMLSRALLCICVLSQSSAFITPSANRFTLSGLGQNVALRNGCLSTSRRAAMAKQPALRCSAEVASWDEIKNMMPAAEQPPAPVLTLYRDTNAWCPFCERVWLALLVKGIPFEEKLVSLYNKPDWYKEMVPTGLVPAIKIHENDEVLWESNDILKRIEAEDFAGYPSLIPTAEADAANKMLEEVQENLIGAVKTVYGAMNTTEELAAAADEFGKDLDKLDAILGKSKSPFFLDSGFSVVDCSYVPIFERLAVQLPSKVPIELRGNPRWPNIGAWFNALEDEVPAYRDRVQGDAYSWTATISMLPGASNLSLTRANRVEAAKEDAMQLLQEQLAVSPSDLALSDREAAVRVLMGNRQAVVQDAVSEAKTQAHLGRLRGEDEEEVDRALRRAALVLLDQDPEKVLRGATAVEGEAAELVAGRLCVPRDMGLPQAACLRSGLGRVVAAAGVAVSAAAE